MGVGFFIGLRRPSKNDPFHWWKDEPEEIFNDTSAKFTNPHMSHQACILAVARPFGFYFAYDSCDSEHPFICQSIINGISKANSNFSGTVQLLAQKFISFIVVLY